MRTVPLHNVNEIQELFDKTDLDAVVVISPRSLWCLTGAARAFARRPGYRRNSCAIAFRNAPPLLITGRFQEEPSRIFSWVRDMTTYSDYLESPLARAAEVLRLRGLASGKIGIEARAHTSEFYDDLVRGLDEAKLIACDDLLETLWTVKQPSEIVVLKDNLDQMAEAIAAALDKSNAGESEDTIHKCILAAMRRTGTASGWGSFVSGPRLTMLRALPSERILVSGDFFRIDYGYGRRNYPARFCRMGVVGQPNHRQLAEFERFTKAVQEAIQKVGPDQSGQQIFALLKQALSEAGFDPAGPPYGNALGIGENSERPGIHPGESLTTRPGMVLSIEPVVGTGFKVNQEIIITDTGNDPIRNEALPAWDDLLMISM
jgi:Xaa-Pro aminopeptidase